MFFFFLTSRHKVSWHHELQSLIQALRPLTLPWKRQALTSELEHILREAELGTIFRSTLKLLHNSRLDLGDCFGLISQNKLKRSICTSATILLYITQIIMRGPQNNSILNSFHKTILIKSFSI